jgi:hypothetical protein
MDKFETLVQFVFDKDCLKILLLSCSFIMLIKCGLILGAFCQWSMVIGVIYKFETCK